MAELGQYCGAQKTAFAVRSAERKGVGTPAAIHALTEET